MAAAAAGGLPPGNLSAAPGRAESKQRFPVNPQALRAAPSPPHPPPTASRFGFLPSTELRPPLGLVLSLDSHLICSMQRNTCIDRTVAEDEVPYWGHRSTAPNCVNLYPCLLCEDCPLSLGQPGKWQKPC